MADISSLKRRILVLVVGDRAARIEALEHEDNTQSFSCVGFLR